MKIKMYLEETIVETGIVGLLINLARLYWRGRRLKTWERVTIVFPETPRCEFKEGANDEKDNP